MTQWHVFYRTVGMQETNTAGWKRSDIQADTAEDAINQLVESEQNVMFARAYPGHTALTVGVVYLPTIEIRHRPHEEEE